MDEIEVLKQIPLFSKLDDTELRGVRAIMRSETFAPGRVIIRQGEPGDTFYVIQSGKVQYLSHDASDNEIIIDEAGAGGFFGELSMLTGEPRAVRVRAVEEVSTLTLQRQQFMDFLVKHPHAAIEVLTVLGQRLHRTDILLRQSVSRNVNDVEKEQLTLGQRVADSFAALMGSWPFIIVQSCILFFWVLLNVMAWMNQWDPYPFILLNLALSFQAAYAAPIIMMSQNRSADKDRLAAEIDHETNVRAELKTGLILKRLDDLEKAIYHR